jgi:CHAT domain-containing protein/tetratricopeptide (TPR) repeat protein
MRVFAMTRALSSRFLASGTVVRHVLAAFVVASAISATLHTQTSNARRALPPTTSQTSAVQEITNLDLGKPVDRELTGRETHVYRVAMSEGQCAEAAVEQRGIDVTVQVLDATGKLVAEFDSESKLQGEERVFLVADAPGVYQLAIQAKYPKAATGRYELRLTEVRAATEQDRAILEAHELSTEARQLYEGGKYDEAIPFAERALTVAEKISGADDVYVAQLLSDLASIYDAKSDHAKPQALLERALGILRGKPGPEDPRTALVAGRLGGIYAIEGDYDKADRLIQPALATEEKTLGPAHPWVAVCLRSLGLLYRDRGDSAKAKEAYARALEIVEKNLGTEDLLAAELRANLGAVYSDEREYQRAKPLFERALVIKQTRLGPENVSLAWILQSLGVIARDAKEYDKAEQYYLRALSIREKALGPEHRDVAANLINLGNLYRERGDYPTSLKTHFHALEILEKSAGPYQWITVVCLGNIAKTYAAMGDVKNAVEFQSRTDAAIEGDMVMNLAIGSEREKLVFLETDSERTDRTVSLSLQVAPGDPDASELAALVLLQRKARVLDAMTDTLASLRRRADQNGKALLDQLNDAAAELARLSLSGGSETSERQKRIQSLETRKEDLEAEISRQNEEFRARSQPVTLQAVQSALPSDAALLEFAVYRPYDPKIESNASAYGKPRYAVFVVRKDGKPEGKDLGDAKVIDHAIDELGQALHDPQRKDVRALARSIDRLILDPLRPLLGDATRLLVSPDGQMDLVPLEAFLDHHGQYEVESYSITYLSAGRDLLRMKVTRPSKSPPLIIADPAFGEPATAALARADQTNPKLGIAANRPRSVTAGQDLSDVYFAPLDGTAQEARAIQALYPEAEILTGVQATKAALKQVVAPSILHIATHGFFLQEGNAAAPASQGRPRANNTRAVPASARIENPLLRSGLALSGANLAMNGKAEGILTALEASNLDLWGTKLVTLSACDTGVGEVKNGEGVYGLRRAFFLAGAESLVMSLWPVSDRVTREMMTAYYAGLKRGLGRGEALRQAELDMMKRKDRQHPFYWASFIQSGEWANLEGHR